MLLEYAYLSRLALFGCELNLKLACKRLIIRLEMTEYKRLLRHNDRTKVFAKKKMTEQK
jgi:hypothetical protein